MRVFKTLVAATGLVFAAACSDTAGPTAGIEPTFVDPGFVKGKGGGIGDPHFTTETACTFNTETGRLACDYQFAGLASSSSAAGVMHGNVIVSWSCDYPGTSKDYNWQKVGWDVDFIVYADKSGNAKGHVENTPAYLIQPLCLPKYISGSGIVTPTPSALEYYLDQYASPFAAAFLTDDGTWSLYALVTTPKGGIRYKFYEGAWTPEVVG